MAADEREARPAAHRDLAAAEAEPEDAPCGPLSRPVTTNGGPPAALKCKHVSEPSLGSCASQLPKQRTCSVH
jgi:hypothetical protein